MHTTLPNNNRGNVLAWQDMLRRLRREPAILDRADQEIRLRP